MNMKHIILRGALILLIALSALSTYAQETTEVSQSVDGNTRGIMLLILLGGLGLVALAGFLIGVIQNEEQPDDQSS